MNLGTRVHGQADRVAFIDCRDWQHPAFYTYGDIDAMADAVAHDLCRRGLRPGQTVAILSLNRVEFAASYLGILRAGMVVLPINHQLPVATVRHILADADARLVYCDAALKALPADGLPVVVWPDAPAVVPAGPRFEPVDRAEADRAMILYTSGSTGVPKGVPLTQGGYRWVLESRLRGGPHDHHRLLVAAPLYHINALGVMAFSLAAGACLIMLPRFDTRHYIESIERFRCTWLTSVTAMMAMVVREDALLARTDLSSVERVRMGSAPVSAKLFADVRRVFPGASVANAYGTTEAGPLVFGPREGAGALPDACPGWPLPGVECRLVDEQGRDAEAGMLWVRTPACMTGYLNAPEATREAMTEDGWSKTGDVFRRDERGAYWFVGRADDMFVCGGENIYPLEVERLLERHPDIRQACVVSVEDEIKGAKPYAFVVARPGARLSEDDVKQYALAHGPAYMHPRHVSFLEHMPLAGTNKVDRRQLSQWARAAVAGGAGRPAPECSIPNPAGASQP